MESILRRRLKGGQFGCVPLRRRQLMARIGPGAGSTERFFRMTLVRLGIRGWRINHSVESTRPDIYFTRERVAVFLDGCFWHGCPRCGHLPRTRRPFWRQKLLLNRRRDQRDTARLTEKSVTVIRIWEHDLRDPKKVARVLTRLSQALVRECNSYR